MRMTSTNLISSLFEGTSFASNFMNIRSVSHLREVANGRINRKTDVPPVKHNRLGEGQTIYTKTIQYIQLKHAN